MTEPGSPADGVLPPLPAGPPSSHRTGVLRVLTLSDHPLTSAEIAGELGVHKNTVRFHLESLIASGQAELVQPVRSRAGRPAQTFRAVRRMDPTGPRHYELLAGVLTDALRTVPDGPARAIAAGHAWGSRAAPSFGSPFPGLGSPEQPDSSERSADPVRESRARLVALLDRFGFGPDHGAAGRDSESSRDGETIGVRETIGARSVGSPVQAITVRQCPFLELATDHQRIVCGVHLGLMRGALAYWGAPFDAEAVLPFVEPDCCLVQLSSGPRATTGPEKGDAD